jgi:prepilin signal peptidase PulO-like enzyme (type II secretory pathway)
LKVAVAHEAVELWQVSHWAVVPIWVTGLVWAFWERKTPLWQVEHLPVMPAWFIVAGDQVMKPLT